MTPQTHDYLRLGLRILDEQLVDCRGDRCGRVEDIEFDAGVGEPANVIGILCGATAWKRRLPPYLAELIPGDARRLRRVSWDVIAHTGNEIELACTAAELTYAAEDERSPMALSELLGRRVVRSGRVRGRVADCVCSRPGEDAE